jgi:autotransporter-associated beta strand protein
MKNRRNLGMSFFVLLGLVLAALSAHAQTNFWWTNWQSAAQGYNWSTNADWTNNSANGNAPLLGGATNYIVNFANGGGVYTVTNDLGANGYGFLLNQLAFSNDAVTLAGDNLVFSRGMALPQVLQNGASNIVFNAGMILATNLTFGGAGTGGITVNSGILGAASLIMNGTNYTLTLNGNNTYTGGTIVNTGAVVMTGNNNFGAGVITVNGGSLTTTGTNTTTGATTVGTGGAATFGGLNNLGAVTVNAAALTFAAGSSNNPGLITVGGGAAGGRLTVNGVTVATSGNPTDIIGNATGDRSTLVINTNMSHHQRHGDAAVGGYPGQRRLARALERCHGLRHGGSAQRRQRRLRRPRGSRRRRAHVRRG